MTMSTLDEVRAETARVGAEYKAARQLAAEKHEQIVPLVIALAEADAPQHEIMALTELTRNTIRLIERRAGIVRRRPQGWTTEAGS